MIVIGLGNRFRQDDAVGLVVARQLRKAVPRVSIVEHEGDPLDLLSLWIGHDLAILIDALNAPEEAGHVRFLDPDVDAPPDRAAIVSSHGHSLWDAWDLACLLDQRPQRALIIAISGRNFGYGEELSPEVRRAVKAATSHALSAVASCRPV